MSKLILVYSILSIFMTSGQCQAEVCPTPSTKNNGVWWCNEDQKPSSYCYLKCNPGYVALFTSTSCISGVWTDLDKMECEQSVFLLIDGQTDPRDNISSEIFHNLENVTCTNHLPHLEGLWLDYNAFVHNGFLYLCGSKVHTSVSEFSTYWCASLNMTDQSGQWKYHFFFDEMNYFETIIIQDKLYFLPRDQTDYTVWTTLPLENEPKLNPVSNLPFLFGFWECIVQTTGDSFIAIGFENIYIYNKAAMNYNESTAIITSFPRPKELDGEWITECEVTEEGGKQWLVLVGGFPGDLTLPALTKAVRLNLNDGLPDDHIQWESLGQLNVPRVDFKMGVNENGIFAMGGYNFEDEINLDTVEMFDWESKKWKIIEQKLNAARVSFGKVEIPASIFNCEKNK